MNISMIMVYASITKIGENKYPDYIFKMALIILIRLNKVWILLCGPININILSTIASSSSSTSPVYVQWLRKLYAIATMDNNGAWKLIMIFHARLLLLLHITTIVYFLGNINQFAIAFLSGSKTYLQNDLWDLKLKRQIPFIWN